MVFVYKMTQDLGEEGISFETVTMLSILIIGRTQLSLEKHEVPIGELNSKQSHLLTLWINIIFNSQHLQ